MKDLYQNRCQQLKSQKHLHLYTHFSSVSLISYSLFMCIIGTLKNGFVLAFYLYLTCVISHCRSLFSCILVCVEIHVPPRVDNPPVSQPNPFHTCSPELQSIRISIISLLGMVRAGQLQNVVPELCSAARPERHGPTGVPWAASTPPAPATDGCYHSKDSQREQRCLKTHVIWPSICRTVSHICKGCVAPLQRTALSECVGEDARLVFTSSCNLLLVFSAELGI